MARITGSYEKLGDLNYFIPDQLPPQNPPLTLNEELTALYGSAMLQLGQLNEMAQRLPNPERFIKAYIIKEAMLSSAIENIHTTLADIFSQPISDVKPNKETQLVLNYTKALQSALEIMQKQGYPISSRVILSAHQALMSTGEGERANPGNYRKQSVRVGNLVPPSAPHIPKLMSDLEKYIHDEDSLPPLIKAGLVHVQFETIHPFLDGNGRIGRLLIVLMLIENNLIKTPILYPSYYFKKHQLEYYTRLDAVRTQGDFEGWIRYYLQAIEASSYDAYIRAKDVELLEQTIRQKVEDPQLDAVLKILFQYPIITITELAIKLDKSYNTANRLLNECIEMGFVSTSSERKRNKRYQFDAYLALLEKEY